MLIKNSIGSTLDSVGAVGEEDQVAFHINFYYQFGINVISARALTCGELFGKSLNDYGIFDGITSASSKFLASFGVGVGFVDGQISHGLFSTKEPDILLTKWF